MKLIVGLGNPGSAYSKTRHNIGRRVVESLARKCDAKWKEGKSLKSRWAEVGEKKDSFIFAIPNVFMNESGVAVRLLVDHFGIDFKSDLLIVVDDFALPFGKLRLRATGTDGGHRGLRSIEEALGNRSYARLRVGIGTSSDSERSLEAYVLSRFEEEEEEGLKDVIDRCVESCKLWVSGSVEKAMDRTNKPL